MNPIFWQFEGIGLKVILSRELSLLITRITKSNMVGILSGLFFSATLAGMESFVWVSAHTSSLMLIFFLPAFILWIKEGITIKGKILTYILLTLTVMVSPARGLCLIILLPLWDFLIKPINKERIGILFKKSIFFTGFFISNLFIVHFFIVGSSVDKVVKSFSVFNNYVNFIHIIGNLFLGWILPTRRRFNSKYSLLLTK